MFLIDRAQVSPLNSSNFHSEINFYQELEKVFKGSWQFACLADDLEEKYGYLAKEISGVPVLIRRNGDKFTALKNICSHRQSMLVPNGSGTMAQVKCGYHGWEFQDDGKLKRMTDGKSFVGCPSAKSLSLNVFPVHRVGPFVFINLSGSDCTFEEFLGEYYRPFIDFFEDTSVLSTWECEHSVNWKIICDNAVESYHVPLVHPTTFKRYHPESLHLHCAGDNFTLYRDINPIGNSLSERIYKVLCKMIVKSPTYERFAHCHVFPNILLFYSELYRSFTVVEPLSPTKSRYTFYEVISNQPRPVPGYKLIHRMVTKLLGQQIKKILKEDMVIWPQIDNGIKNSSRSAIFGRREDRVYLFHKFLASKMQMVDFNTEIRSVPDVKVVIRTSEDARNATKGTNSPSVFETPNL